MNSLYLLPRELVDSILEYVGDIPSILNIRQVNRECKASIEKIQGLRLRAISFLSILKGISSRPDVHIFGSENDREEISNQRLRQFTTDITTCKREDVKKIFDCFKERVTDALSFLDEEVIASLHLIQHPFLFIEDKVGTSCSISWMDLKEHALQLDVGEVSLLESQETHLVHDARVTVDYGLTVNNNLPQLSEGGTVPYIAMPCSVISSRIGHIWDPDDDGDGMTSPDTYSDDESSSQTSALRSRLEVYLPLLLFENKQEGDKVELLLDAGLGGRRVKLWCKNSAHSKYGFGESIEICLLRTFQNMKDPEYHFHADVTAQTQLQLLQEALSK